MEITQAQAGQKEAHKHRLTAHKSLSKGGLILAYDALQRIKVKLRKEADNKLRKVKRAITLVENKARNELYKRGVQGRRDEKARITYIKEQQVLGAEIPHLI